MRERVDTFQVGPSTESGIKGLIQAKEAQVLAEARKTANGRTISMSVTMTVENGEHIAHIYIEHKDEPESAFNMIKQRTVTTETWGAGVYSSPALSP